MQDNSKNQIPAGILKAIEESEVYTALEKIGDTYGLLIDQIGSLDMVTRQVLLGNIKSSDYIDEIAKELEISNQTAEKIATDVNTKIFTPLKESMRKSQEATIAPPPAPSIAPIEKAGNFTVEKPQPSASSIYKEESLKREDVLADLERINDLKPENATKFVDHLLPQPPQQVPIAPRVVPLTKVQPESPQIPPSQQDEQKKYTADPYRESI